MRVANCSCLLQVLARKHSGHKQKDKTDTHTKGTGEIGSQRLKEQSLACSAKELEHP